MSARELCEIGRRLWLRGYVAGTDGNLSVRTGSDRVLCTPRLVSKGFMKPADLCVVNLQGRQIAGRRPRTTEILVHLAIMKTQPQARAVVHYHAPHATAWAALGRNPPANIFPEKEVWLGPIVTAPYRLSGTAELAAVVAPLAREHYVILLANHGVITWGETLTEAYDRVEMLESYLQTLAIARATGGRLRRLTRAQMRPLLELKRRLGLVDPRL